MTFVVVLAAIGTLLQSGGRLDDLAMLALLSGILYGAGAQMLFEARMVYVSGGFLAGSGVLWLSASRLETWGNFGFLLLGVSAAALALAAFNRKRTALGIGPIGLAEAWARVAESGVVWATVLVWTHVANLLLAPASANMTHDTALGGLMALLCGAFYLVFARWERAPVCIYVGLTTWVAALLNGLTLQRASTGAYPLALMLYGIALCLLSSVLTPRAEEAEQSQRGKSRGREIPMDWATPFAHCGHAVAALGVLLAAVLPLLTSLHAAWAGTTATLTLGTLLYAATARKRQSVEAVYAALGCAAYASALLTWRLLPKPLSLADCLAPFALVSACIALSLSRKQADAGKKEIPPSSFLLPPFSSAALFAIALSLTDSLRVILAGPMAAHLSLSLLPSLIAAALVSVTRRETKPDGLRTLALLALCIGSGLEVAAWSGLAGGIATWTAVKMRGFGGGLVALAWFWWLFGQTLPRLAKTDVWSEELAVSGLATAFVSTLALTFAGTLPGRAVGPTLPLFEICLAGAFALYVLHIYRHREEAALLPSLALVLFIGMAHSLNLSPTTPFVVPALTLFALSAAGIYLVLARRLEIAEVAHFAAFPLVGGIALTAFWRLRFPVSTSDALLSDILWSAGGAVLAWATFTVARWSARNEFTYAAALTLTGAYLRAVTIFWQPQPQWHALLLLPFLIGLYGMGVGRWGTENRRGEGEKGRRGKPHYPTTQLPNYPTAEGDALFGTPLRRTALAISFLALLWSSGNGDGVFLTHGGVVAPWLVTLTLAAYGAAFTALAAFRRTTETVAVCATTLTAAYLHYLLTLTPLLTPYTLHPTPYTLSWPHFAFWAVQAALFWIAVGWRAQRRYERADLAAPLLTLAGGVSLLSALVGLLTVLTPNEGRWTVLTLGWAGAVWFALWLLEQGEVCLHVGTWNLLCAWALIVHDQTGGADVQVLDIHLLPVGLYLITVGHLMSRRERLQQAQGFWWAGLLLIITPTFLSYRKQSAPWHTALLLVECLAAVLWGIGQRIRAFIYAGMAFTAAYAASATVGQLPETFGTLVSLFIGVGLFIAGFYALTHREMVQRWAATLEAQWKAWQAWR